MECIIRLETDAKKISVAFPTLDSFLKLLERSRQRAQYMDNSAMDFFERTRNLNPGDLLAKNTSYHKSYADIANTTKIERAKNCTTTSLKAANHLWLSEKQVDLPLQQLKWKKPLTTR